MVAAAPPLWHLGWLARGQDKARSLRPPATLNWWCLNPLMKARMAGRLSTAACQAVQTASGTGWTAHKVEQCWKIVQEGNMCEVSFQYLRKLAGYAMQPPGGASPCDEGGCMEINHPSLHHQESACSCGRKYLQQRPQDEEEDLHHAGELI
jgi:hypothetical protein